MLRPSSESLKPVDTRVRRRSLKPSDLRSTQLSANESSDFYSTEIHNKLQGVLDKADPKRQKYLGNNRVIVVAINIAAISSNLLGKGTF